VSASSSFSSFYVSFSFACVLSPAFSYDKGSEIAKKAHAEGLTLRESVLQLGYLTGDEFDRLIVPADMISPLAPKL